MTKVPPLDFGITRSRQVKFLRAAEHLAADIPQFRVHRAFDQLVGSLLQISEPARPPGPGIAADDPRHRRQMRKTPFAERILEIDQLLAELVQLWRAHAVPVDVTPCPEYCRVLLTLNR